MSGVKKIPLSVTPTGAEYFLFLVAAINLFGGIVAALVFLPEYGDGLAYLPSLMFFFSGVVSFALFYALSKLLESQRKIVWLLSNEKNSHIAFNVPPIQKTAKQSSLRTQDEKDVGKGGGAKYGENFPQY